MSASDEIKKMVEQHGIHQDYSPAPQERIKHAEENWPPRLSVSLAEMNSIPNGAETVRADLYHGTGDTKYISLAEHQASLTQASTLLERKDREIEELRATLEGARKQADYLQMRCSANEDQEIPALRAENKKLVAALETVMNQPFCGDWDAQAAFVSSVICEHRRAALAARGDKERGT